MYYIVKRNNTDSVSLCGGQIVNDVKEGENEFFLMYYIKDI